MPSSSQEVIRLLRTSFEMAMDMVEWAGMVKQRGREQHEVANLRRMQKTGDVGVQDRVVELVPAGLRVTHPIHPVPRPTLAEVQRGKQLVDHLAKRIGGSICQKHSTLGNNNY